MRKSLHRSYRVARYVLYKETLLEPADHFWTFLGAFTGIALLGYMQQAFPMTDRVFLIGSFGASCVLIFGATDSPLAQPRNVLGGHVLASVIGVTVHKCCPDTLWLAAGLAVSLSIVGMQITKTLHPPAGATALIANIGTDKIKALGYGYTVSPVFTGVSLLVLVAIVINNIPENRQYPRRPFRPKKRKRLAVRKPVPA
jgi:CBS domain-containing membrane protein